MGETPGRSILLADDNPVNRHSLTLLLRKLGHTVVAVTDGSEALDALRDHPYDVLVLDLHMPRLDGPETVRRVREEWSADERPRLLILTASTASEARDRCLAAGVDAFLVKPANIQQLDLAIRGEAEALAPETPEDPAGDQAIDESVLGDVAEEMGDDDDSLIAELIAVFLTDASRRVGELREAIRDGDPVAFGSTAHALKGGAGAVGALALARSCRACEFLSPVEFPQRSQDLLGVVESELDRAREALLALRPPS